MKIDVLVRIGRSYFMFCFDPLHWGLKCEYIEDWQQCWNFCFGPFHFEYYDEV